MAELFTAIAIILMIAAVIGSFAPMLPGGLLSVIGILVYWYGTGYTRPGNLFLAGFILVGLFGTAADYLSGVIAAKVGGASTKTGAIAGIVGFILFFVLGPIGILLGVVGTVLVREYLRTGEADNSAKAAFYSSIGVLGSGLVQFVVTFSLLISFIIALVI